MNSSFLGCIAWLFLAYKSFYLLVLLGELGTAEGGALTTVAPVLCGRAQAVLKFRVEVVVGHDVVQNTVGYTIITLQLMKKYRKVCRNCLIHSEAELFSCIQASTFLFTKTLITFNKLIRE